MSFFNQHYSTLCSEKKKDKDMLFLYETLVHQKGRTKLKKQIIPELGVIADTWTRLLRPMWTFYAKKMTLEKGMTKYEDIKKVLRSSNNSDKKLDDISDLFDPDGDEYENEQ